MNHREPTIIGRNVTVDFIGHFSGVPAKIDTGADSSSVWASDIHVDEAGTLRFSLFDKGSPYYTGEIIERVHYTAVRVRSTTGHEQIRYKVQFSLRVAGRRIRVSLNLSDRSSNKFPVLIGRRTLSGRFTVDVKRFEHSVRKKIVVDGLDKELKEDPRAFFNKYHGKDI